jgi:hypothetical protein
MWRSLVAHLVWDQGVAGSNPVIPTIAILNAVIAITSETEGHVSPEKQYRTGYFARQSLVCPCGGMVDTPDSKLGSARSVGSSPTEGTFDEFILG